MCSRQKKTKVNISLNLVSSMLMVTTLFPVTKAEAAEAAFLADIKAGGVVLKDAKERILNPLPAVEETKFNALTKANYPDSDSDSDSDSGTDSDDEYFSQDKQAKPVLRNITPATPVITPATKPKHTGRYRSDLTPEQKQAITDRTHEDQAKRRQERIYALKGNTLHDNSVLNRALAKVSQLDNSEFDSDSGDKATTSPVDGTPVAVTATATTEAATTPTAAGPGTPPPPSTPNPHATAAPGAATTPTTAGPGTPPPAPPAVTAAPSFVPLPPPPRPVTATATTEATTGAAPTAVSSSWEVVDGIPIPPASFVPPPPLPRSVTATATTEATTGAATTPTTAGPGTPPPAAAPTGASGIPVPPRLPAEPVTQLRPAASTSVTLGAVINRNVSPKIAAIIAQLNGSAGSTDVSTDATTPATTAAAPATAATTAGPGTPPPPPPAAATTPAGVNTATTTSTSTTTASTATTASRAILAGKVAQNSGTVIPNATPAQNAPAALATVQEAESVVTSGTDAALVDTDVKVTPLSEADIKQVASVGFVKETINSISESISESIISNLIITESVFSILNDRMDATMIPNVYHVGVAAGEEASAPSKGFWVRGSYGKARQKNALGKTSYNSIMNSFTIGADSDFGTDGANLYGLAYTNSSNSVKSKLSSDRTSVSSHTISAYNHTDINDKVYLQAIAAFAVSKFTNTSEVLVDSGNHALSVSTFRGREYSAGGVVGYKADMGKFVLLPEIGLKYGNIREGGYSKGESEAFNVSVTPRSKNMLKGTLGFKTRLKNELVLKNVHLVPTLHASVDTTLSERSKDTDVTLNWKGQQLSRSVKPRKSNKFGYNVGVGLIATRRNTEVGFNYNCYLTPKYTSHQGSLRVGVKF